MTTEEMLAQVLSAITSLGEKVDSIETRMATHEDIVSVRRDLARTNMQLAQVQADTSAALYVVTETIGRELDTVKQAK